MAYVWQRWMAREFREAGLDVIEVAGSENRGRPASSGSFDPYGLNVHHVGVRSSAGNPTAGLQVLIGGRPDLPGPVAHFGTDYHGRIWVIACGRANVNGPNRGVPNFPKRDGNAALLGNEVFTDGTQEMPQAQVDAIALSSAVVLKHYGHDDDVDGYLYRHADTSTSGKWDIGQLSTRTLRDLARHQVTLLNRPPSEEDTDMALSQSDRLLLRRDMLEQANKAVAPALAGLKSVSRQVADLDASVDTEAVVAKLDKLIESLRPEPEAELEAEF